MLGLLGIEFDVVPADVDETPLPSETPAALILRLAAGKATEVARGQASDAVVVGADTIVDVDGAILGKPGDVEHARRMLRLLSGRTHYVHTGVAVVTGGAMQCGTSTTAVTMVELTDAEIEWYVGTGEPLDKAGAYGLQGHAGIFVSSVAGSVSGVLGLPLNVLITLLRAIAS